MLGHIQRGGSPVAHDRIPASRMGAYAIELARATVPLRRYPERKMVHHDIIDAIENMKRPFKGDWLETAKTVLIRRSPHDRKASARGAFLWFIALYRGTLL